MCNKIFDPCKGKNYFDFIFVMIDLVVRFHRDFFSNDKIFSDNFSQEANSGPSKSLFIWEGTFRIK